MMAESSGGSSSGTTGIVAIVAIVLLVMMGFFVFRGGLFRSGGGSSPGFKGNVEIKTPAPSAPSAPASGQR
jgi:hypothetical protein